MKVFWDARLCQWVRGSWEVSRIFRKLRNYLSGGFGGLEVACWPLVPKFAKPLDFFRAKKNPQHAFLRRGSKAVCPMSIYGV